MQHYSFLVCSEFLASVVGIERILVNQFDAVGRPASADSIDCDGYPGMAAPLTTKPLAELESSFVDRDDLPDKKAGRESPS